MYEIEHTSEHIFVRALQNLGKRILVRKVEHGEVNRAYIEVDSITLDDIYDAELITNNVIDEGREVREYTFNTLHDAKMRFPDLRSYDDRIEGRVRVIEIDGYDHSACIRSHVDNSKMCQFFMVTHLSREGDLYKIEFLAGSSAKLKALEYSMRCLKIAYDLNVSMNTLEGTIRNMKRDVEVYKKRCREYSEKMLDEINAERVGSIKLYDIILDGVDDKIVSRRVNELIDDDDVIVFVRNRMGMVYNIILASSDNLDIDCKATLDTLREHGYKGGGRSRFAVGALPIDREDKLASIKTQIYKRYQG